MSSASHAKSHRHLYPLLLSSPPASDLPGPFSPTAAVVPLTPASVHGAGGDPGAPSLGRSGCRTGGLRSWGCPGGELVPSPRQDARRTPPPRPARSRNRPEHASPPPPYAARRCPGPALASATPCLPPPSCWASRATSLTTRFGAVPRVADLLGDH